MKPSIEEVKIIEKVKFWEEQEKINTVLVKIIFDIVRLPPQVAETPR